MSVPAGQELETLNGAPPTLTARGVVDALRDATAAEATDVRERAAAHETYARLKGWREQYQAAGEVKLWAERRLGQMRTDARAGSRDPRADPRGGWGIKAFDEELGLNRWHSRKWEVMAQIPSERFAEILAEIREADGAYNANGVLARDLRSYEQRIERGIYQIRDGRYVLQWKHRGTKHREVLATHDIARARVELAVRTGKIQETYGQDPHTVDSVYALVRRAAQALDKIDRRDASHEAKIALNRAMPHLHRAEDELVQAINNWDAKK